VLRQAPKAASTSGKKSKKSSTSTTVAVPSGTAGPEKLAMDTATRQAALRASQLQPTDTSVAFSAKTTSTQDVVTLTVTSRANARAAVVASNWAKAFASARRQAALEANVTEQQALVDKARSLQTTLKPINDQLNKNLPGGHVPPPAGSAPSGGGKTTPTTGNQTIPVGAQFLLAQRDQLVAEVRDATTKYGKLAAASVLPDSFARTEGQTPAVRITKVKSTTVPAALGLFGGLVLGLLAAIAADMLDRTIREPRRAAAVFDAPVLSIIPVDRDNGDFSVLTAPQSYAGQAYRSLAATSVATDRLPKAIMVSSPHGDAYGEVAANFAAALARLGLRVALVATSPEQAWFLESFTAPLDGAVTLPELLTQAHDGTLNGQLERSLPGTDLSPNLVVVPPGPDELIELPLDGLPTLLQALADAGIDVAVVAGPPLLEDPQATIIAWATRTVLWAVQSGEITEEEARAAATRLELAGVTPFGVVMVGRRRAEV
jgi:capsular polysaccharide biosynthesis protein